MAIQGIISGAGFLVTLLDVRIKDNRVQGIENLIEGLSGKFVSSIVALAAATIFLLGEKPPFHRLANSQQRLVAAIDAVVPRLSAVCLLAGIQQGIVEQAAAFRHFSVDLFAKLWQVIGGSRGSTLPIVSRRRPW